MTTHIDADGAVSVTKRRDERSTVHLLHSSVWKTLTCTVTDTGNGFIAKFPAMRSTQQDYFVCLDYSQAHDLVLGLLEFQSELGFKTGENK